MELTMTDVLIMIMFLLLYTGCIGLSTFRAGKYARTRSAMKLFLIQQELILRSAHKLYAEEDDLQRFRESVLMQSDALSEEEYEKAYEQARLEYRKLLASGHTPDNLG